MRGRRALLNAPSAYQSSVRQRNAARLDLASGSTRPAASLLPIRVTAFEPAIKGLAEVFLKEA
jgi:hypothetical protein